MKFNTNTTKNPENYIKDEKGNFQFICEKCGEGFNQKSRIERHMETSHPKPAPSAADVEKALAGIDYPLTKEEVINYVKQKEKSLLSYKADMKNNNNDLLNLIQSLPARKYRDSAEIAKALGEIKSGKGIKSKEEAEAEEQPSKKGGRASITSSVSAASIAKVLSGIDFPKAKNEIQEYAKRNVSLMETKENIAKDVLNVLDKITSKNYHNMADIEKEIGKIL